MADQFDLADCLRHIRRLASAADGKIVCHAEGEDAVMSAIILFAHRGQVVLRFPDDALTNSLFANWNASAKAGRPWAALEISIEDARVSPRFFAPTEYPAGTIEERIPRLVRAHFGADDWDDNDPEPRAPRKPWWRFW